MSKETKRITQVRRTTTTTVDRGGEDFTVRDVLAFADTLREHGIDLDARVSAVPGGRWGGLSALTVAVDADTGRP